MSDAKKTISELSVLAKGSETNDDLILVSHKNGNAFESMAMALSAVGSGGGSVTNDFGYIIIQCQNGNYSPTTGITIDGHTYKMSDCLYVDGGNSNNLALPASFAVPAGKIVTFNKEENLFLKKNGVEINVLTHTVAAGDIYIAYFWECLSPETEILLADMTTKQLKDINARDMVMSPFGPDKVIEVSQGEGTATDEWEFEDGTIVKTIGRHRFWNCELNEPMYLEAWNIGEHAKKQDGSKTALVSHRRIEGPAPHATLFTEKWNLYYANGLLAGNRKSTKEINA